MQTYKIKIYNSQYSFVKFNDVSKFKELLLDSIPKDKMIFHKKFTMLKNVHKQKIMKMQKQKFQTTSKIFLMICITFIKKDMKKNLLQIKKDAQKI